MSPSRSSIRIRPRSAIADADLARIAVTDLPRSYVAAVRAAEIGPRALMRGARTLGRPLEPDRVIVMPLATLTSPLRYR